MTDQDTVPGGQAGSTSPPDEALLRDALSRAEAMAQENWNKYLRAAAELDNLRKRAARDIDQARKFGAERLAGDLLAVLESLEKGVEAGASATAEALLEGKKATLRLVKSALDRAGVVELAPSGQQFDPQLHEALSIRPTAVAEPGVVVEVVQKGYQLNGRLLRPARVVVAGSLPEPTVAESGQPDGTA